MTANSTSGTEASVSSKAQSIRTTTILLAIILLATFLRFHQIGSESFWQDETTMLRLTSQDLGVLIPQLVQSGRPPLYVLFSWVWTNIFGTGEAAVRLLSALLGIASIPMIFAVGNRLFGKKVGLISALVMSLSVFHVYYSQENRYYSLMMLLTLLAVYFLLRAFRDRRWKDFMLHAFFSVLLYYTHKLGALMFLAMGLYFLLYWKRYKDLRQKWIVAQVVIIVLILPDIALFLGRISGRLPTPEGSYEDLVPWIVQPNIFAPLWTWVKFLFRGRTHIEAAFVISSAATLVLGTLVLAFRQGIGRWWESVKSTAGDVGQLLAERDEGLVFLLFWFLLPTLLLLVISITIRPFYVNRYLSTTAPALFILIALGIVTARKVVPIAISIAALTLSLGAGLSDYYDRQIKQQWREAAAYLETHVEPGDVIGINGEAHNDVNALSDAFYWYYPGERSACMIDGMVSTAEVVEQMKACDPGSGRLWLVSLDWQQYYNGVSQPGLKPFFSNPIQEGAELIDMQEFAEIRILVFDLD